MADLAAPAPLVAFLRANLPDPGRTLKDGTPSFIGVLVCSVCLPMNKGVVFSDDPDGWRLAVNHAREQHPTVAL